MELEGLIESGAVTLKPLETEKEKEMEMEMEMEKKMGEAEKSDITIDTIASNQLDEMDANSTSAAVRTDMIATIERSDTTSVSMAVVSGNMELKSSDTVGEIGSISDFSTSRTLNAENKKENENESEKKDDVNKSKNISTFIELAEPELSILTFEEFCLALNPLKHSWTQRDDEIIATLVNRVSDKLDLDPLMISSAVLENRRIVSGLLPNRSAHEVQARYAALSVLNKVRNIRFF